MSLLMLTTALTLSSNMAAQRVMSPHDRLESLAATLQSGDLQSITRMGDGVFAIPHFIDIPEIAISLLKEKFMGAEDAYWRGQHPGVHERDVVTALNALADALKLPEYAKTAPSQVRTVRMKMLYTHPRFNGLRFGNKSVSFGGKVGALPDTMSPLQALHLALTLIDAKFTVESYQVTPAEWEKMRAKNLRAEASSSQGIAPQTSPRIYFTNSPQTLELHRRLEAAFGSISDLQGLRMVVQTLNDLGVN
jgi:hypothetical protein